MFQHRKMYCKENELCAGCEEEYSEDEIYIPSVNRPTALTLQLETRSKNAMTFSKSKKEEHHESVSPRSELLCVGCLDENKNVVFVPCHHLCCCEGCGTALQKCPLCR